MTDETKTNNTENNTNNKPGFFSRTINWIKEQKGTIAVFVAGAATGVAATLGIQKYRQGQEEETIVIDDGLEDQYPLQ